MNPRTHRLSPSDRRGATLTEVAVAAALVGVMLVATMQAVGAVFRTRLAARQRQEAEALGRELLAEIFQLPYKDPQGGSTFGPESGETGSTRASFDDVDDYDGYAETPPKDLAGGQLPNSAGWSRQVAIARVEPAAPQVPTSSETGLKRITVTVTSPTGTQTTLQALRSAAGAIEYRPPLDETYITGVRGQVQLGASGQVATGQAALVNHAADH